MFWCWFEEMKKKKKVCTNFRLNAILIFFAIKSKCLKDNAFKLVIPKMKEKETHKHT